MEAKHSKTRGFIQQALVGALFVVVSSACQLNSEIKKLKGLNDFLNTEMIASTGAVADGIDELVVVVHLKNSDGSVVPNYRPEYSITSGLGVITSDCTVSSNEGASICILKSTSPGIKRLRLTNAKQGLEKDVTFSPKPSGPALGLISASDPLATTSGGYKASVSLGGWVASKPVTTPGGYKAYISVQSALDSRN